MSACITEVLTRMQPSTAFSRLRWLPARFARLCRCQPFGTSGLDLVPEEGPEAARWYMPWRYGRWRTCNLGPTYVCEAVEPGDADPR